MIDFIAVFLVFFKGGRGGGGSFRANVGFPVCHRFVFFCFCLFVVFFFAFVSVVVAAVSSGVVNVVIVVVFVVVVVAAAAAAAVQ